MRYLHTMVRIKDLEQSLHFYCEVFGLKEISRKESEAGRFTLIFLAAPEDAKNLGSLAESTQTEKMGRPAPLLELTYNWEPEAYSGGRNFGHLAFEVDNIYSFCSKLQEAGVIINRPPRDGNMAFVRSPDGISIELLQKGPALAPQEPWSSMPNTGTW